ncbi:STAS domain-containing protein [Candidatus Poriferisodalis multihospitum]|uniref:STAS domain-containing protein n=1 Tax=Candidatus Poriferisodalis multihospitum TaxID=2983191 RepID=UPI002B260FBC|nr:STAS domain-containing protein [Candidatus Poriferisodalis multihospitum]
MLGFAERTVTAADGTAVVVVTPRGELDLAAIASLDSALRSALATAGTQPRLVIDLSDVDVLQPVTLGVLLDARRRCRAGDGGLALVVSTPGVAATLSETDVDSLFDVTTGLPAALQRLSNR